MGICVLGAGDCGNKSSSSYTTNVSLINQTMTNMVTSTKDSTIVKSFNTQNIELDVGGDLIDCPITMDQSMDVSQKVSISLNVSSTKALQNQVEQALKQSNETAVKQKTDMLQTASNESSTATTVNQAISNLVTTNITDSVTKELSTLIETLQNGKFKIKGNVDCKGKPLMFTQKMLVTQVVNTLTKALTGTTLSNVVQNKADVKNKTTVDQEGGGIGSVIGSIFSGIAGIFSGPFKYIGICVIALAVIGLIGGVIKMAMTKKESAEVTEQISSFFGFGKKKRIRCGGRRR
jgi:hypothetical protein